MLLISCSNFIHAVFIDVFLKFFAFSFLTRFITLSCDLVFIQFEQKLIICSLFSSQNIEWHIFNFTPTSYCISYLHSMSFPYYDLVCYFHWCNSLSFTSVSLFLLFRYKTTTWFFLLQCSRSLDQHLFLSSFSLFPFIILLVPCILNLISLILFSPLISV